MAELFYRQEVFDKVDFNDRSPQGQEFHDCTFSNCNFAQVQLARAEIIDCVFEGCNLGLVSLAHAKLENARFVHCKLIGIDFSKCADFLFSASFRHCQLDFTSFAGKKLKKTRFEDCSIKEGDFSGCDLTEAVFANCDLTRTLFHRTNLNKADFRTAYHFAIDPEVNSTRKARFSTAGLAGLLAKYDLVID
jgi:fluoroquinolone resistance protein